MSRRVYEIARDLDLSTKEVLDRLNEAGMEVNSPLASVDDSRYERVFGDGLDDATHNGLPEGQKPEILPSSLEPRRELGRNRRVFIYILVATLAFALATGVGALVALTLSGELGFTTGEKQRPTENRGTPQRSEKQGNAQQVEKQGNAQQRETQDNAPLSGADYVSKVGEIQADSVETFLASHNKLLRYDALTADDVEELQANQAALQEFANQAGDLTAPRKYREHKEVFVSAIDELHEAAQVAFSLAADPTSATQSGFEEYDHHVDRAAADLKRSNETLNRDYKTIEGVQRVSPSK